MENKVWFRECSLFIKENLPFSVVFKNYGIPWKGDYTHQVSCPFHGEDNNPSARYYHDSKRFHCFACTEDPGGDVIWFIKKMEGFETWKETYDFIKKNFGVFLPEGDLNARIELRKQLQESLPRKKFGDHYKDKMNDIIYRIKQDRRFENIGWNLVEREIWESWRDIEDAVIENYIEYCESVRQWFADGKEFLRNVLNAHLDKR